MKRSTFFLAGILLANLTLAQTRPVDPIIRQLHDPNSKQVLVVAHRGDWRSNPENSVRAIESAIAMGVDVVEIDLKKTKDGVLILMHDETIDRTTSGHGKPADYTWAELQKLTLKNEHGGPTRQRIPTFEQCMNTAKNRVMINIDKGYDYYKDTYDVLVKTGTVDHAIIKSYKTYEEVKAENGDLLGGKLAYMPIINMAKANAKASIQSYETNLKPVAYELNFSSDSALVNSNYQIIPQTGSKLWFNSLWASQDAGHDDERSVEESQPNDGWGWLIAHGATMIQTDRPAELIAYLRQRKLHR
ncbi:glycerophosphodiester phosphodiesterase family protein [Spirosoma rhododendri]|uniref:Glycerophosphodiester phosphodiesterase family protein n=1 Tax=Spirosoma rhododendri TaxID=2728024 RepID=A0A7L5DMV3_9BACT|nr:glycerophosphodiester phosphodiesterase family protein [Spirosoma rhododendri]QJD79779.1 glycerophosphodiester phosphodiesterase family protein [Spirosoma rhododendri]